MVSMEGYGTDAFVHLRSVIVVLYYTPHPIVLVVLGNQRNCRGM